MKNILRQIYNGEIDPSEMPVLNDSEIGQCCAEARRIEEELVDTLNEEQEAILSRLNDQQSIEQGLFEQRYFVCGWRLGAQVMLESLQNWDDDPIQET